MQLKKILLWFNITISDVARFNEDIARHIRGKLLDIGCGTKQKLFYSKVDKYIGLEFPGAEEINDRYQAIKADVYADALNLPFKAASFDSAVSIAVLEHLKDPQQAVFEAWHFLPTYRAPCR